MKPLWSLERGYETPTVQCDENESCVYGIGVLGTLRESVDHEACVKADLDVPRPGKLVGLTQK